MKRFFPASVLEQKMIHWTDFVHLFAYEFETTKLEPKGIDCISHYYAVHFHEGNAKLLPVRPSDSNQFRQSVATLMPRMPSISGQMEKYEVEEFFKEFLIASASQSHALDGRWIPCPTEERTINYHKNLLELKVLDQTELLEKLLLSKEISGYDADLIPRLTLDPQDIFFTNFDVLKHLEKRQSLLWWKEQSKNTDGSFYKFEVRPFHWRRDRQSLREENTNILKKKSVNRSILESLIDDCRSWGEIDQKAATWHLFRTSIPQVTTVSRRDLNRLGLQPMSPEKPTIFLAPTNTGPIQTAEETSHSTPNVRDRLLNTEEVCDLLGCKSSHFYSKIVKQTGFPRKISTSEGKSQPRYSEKSILEWMTARTDASK